MSARRESGKGDPRAGGDPSGRSPRRIRLSEDRLPSHLIEIGAPDAWEAGYRGGGIKEDKWVTVAVVDSGIDIREAHAREHLNALNRKLYAYVPLWNRQHRAYVPCRVNKGSGYVKTNARYKFIDEFGHGTKMACIIGARPGFDGVVGLVPRVQIYNYRVADEYGKVNPKRLQKAVGGLVKDYRHDGEPLRVALLALDQKAWDPTVTDAILDLLADTRILAVIGAWDRPEGGVDLALEPAHPGSRRPRHQDDNLVVVAAHSRGGPGKERLTDTSNRGAAVDLVAPGRGILSASPMAPTAVYGTSAAAALAAGAAALIAGNHPDLTVPELRRKLLELGRFGGAEIAGATGTGRILDLHGLARRAPRRKPTAAGK